MSTRTVKKSSIFVFPFFFITFLAGASSFGQTPEPRGNGKIAFASDRDGNFEIYVMNNDGTSQVRLTNSSDSESYPEFSPDGKRIAFFSKQTPGALNGYFKIMNVDGTNQIVVTPASSYGTLSWSPDGRKIAFVENREIFTINIDGSNRTNLTRNSGNDSHPVWSPDGARILFVREKAGYAKLHTMNAADGNDLKALPGGASFSDDLSPDWSRAVNKITFTETPEDFWPIIYTANADGSNRQIFDGNGFGGSGDRGSPKWSPDGAKIAFQHRKYPGLDVEIYKKNVNGGDAIQLTNSPGYNGLPSWQPLLPPRSFADFDGDGRSDVSVYRPLEQIWYINGSQTGYSTTQFGLSTDQITPGDFDGDGKTDIAVWRPSTGIWYIQRSTAGLTAIQWGLPTDLPVQGDFDGDGKSDIAVWRPFSGVWFVLNSSSGQSAATQFGQDGDQPVAGDYDGDGKADLAVYRPSSGIWFINRSTQGQAAFQFGISTDKPVPADYDGDGKTDIAVYRDGPLGVWYLQQSTAGFASKQFGMTNDVPVPGDYDGDGKADISVWRPSNGIWFQQRSTSGFNATQFGMAGDQPTQAAYFGN